MKWGQAEEVVQPASGAGGCAAAQQPQRSTDLLRNDEGNGRANST